MTHIEGKQYDKILQNQKNYFYTNVTKSLEWRKDHLMKLENMIRHYEKDILFALKEDLGKSEFEAYTTEIGFLLDSIKATRKKIAGWMKPKRANMPIHQVGSTGKIMYEPYGSVLIIGPFNYPFQLLIEPLVAAISAGNTAVIKPSEYTPNTSKLLEIIISQTFDPQAIAVVTGERETTSKLIHMPFDHIFFTGSVAVGKIVMEAAAKNLTPVTLELGGKSPTIVDHSANIKVSARRIVWGKFMNAGQTCIAPDYIYVHENVLDPFIKELKKAIVEFYGEHIHKNEDYGRIVNGKHFDRLSQLIDEEKVIFGGQVIEAEKYIEPTILHPVSWSDPVMADEIFGPLLPILTYSNLNEVISEIRTRPKPLALYVFTENKAVEDRVMNELSFGGGCVNDTISHVTAHELPFGGVGHSGQGHYHGKYGFRTLSHTKSVLKKSTKVDIRLAFPPYKGKLKLIKQLLK